MTDSAVKCVTEPCTISCPDVKVLVHPPPICLTVPGMRLKTDPKQCLMETKEYCLTNGSDGCPTEVVTKSSGVRAISGESTPCSVITGPDSKLIIYPPAMCLILPGASATSYPNECLIETSSPCDTRKIQPQDLTDSTTPSDCSFTSNSLLHSPRGLKSKAPQVIRAPGQKLRIQPAPIEVTMCGCILEVDAQECMVEIFQPCESNGDLTKDEYEVKSLKAPIHPCTVEGESSCVIQGQDMKMVIIPPAFELDFGGAILSTCPDSCKVEVVNPSPPQPAVQSGFQRQALCGNATTSPAFSNMSCTMKRPMPDIRRSARPWSEIYSHSITPRRMMAQQAPFSRFCKSYQQTY